MLTAYLILAAWFCILDMLAGRIAGSQFRPFHAALLALVWPLSLAFTLLAAAAIMRRYRDASAKDESP